MMVQPFYFSLLRADFGNRLCAVSWPHLRPTCFGSNHLEVPRLERRLSMAGEARLNVARD